ncbi:PilZ domain-containing protein [Aestuariicella sp. G3-2]|uniref:PilZ domain-containing protein n=1 Tax=Pseudomaricurvus albidus TaxID=2842452 RepID=UPI001C0E449A|nr:PilZ domain-containing protein [Aestuariicella albida]MBU3070371.1 PilZ domain-containing protein [Aestuariicella albida]
MTTTERRNYFRVSSELMLKIQKVDAKDSETSQPEDLFPEDKQASYLIQELHRLDNEAMPHLSSIAELSRPLADYLSILNKKIDMVAQHCSSPYLHTLYSPKEQTGEASQDACNNPVLVQVNLSEDGIAFYSADQWKEGDFLGLRLQFLNDYSHITCFARVLRCEPQDNDTFKTACQFQQLSKNALEALRRHIMQAQLSAIRQQRMKKETR